MIVFHKPPKLPHELTEGEQDQLIIEIAHGILREARKYGSADAPQMAKEFYILFDGLFHKKVTREDVIAFIHKYKKEWLVNSHHRGDFVGVFKQTL